MELTINLDLQTLISQSVSVKRIQPLLDKAIEDAMKDAIRDATGYSSPFRKAIAQQLLDAMPHGLGIDDVAKFQNVLNDELTRAVHGENAKTIQVALAQAAQQAIPNTPASIKLSELIKEARGSFLKEEHEAFYAHWEDSQYGGGGWLSLDGDEDCRSEHCAAIRLAVTKEGEVYSLRMYGKNITPQSRPDVISRFESLLMAMYVGRTRLEIDCDEYAVESAAASQFD